MNDIIFWPAAKMAAAIRDKEVSTREVVDAHLARIAAVNPALNAVVQLAAERAQAEARQRDIALARDALLGPLHGVPFTVKDSLCTEGIITTAGTLGRTSFLSARDATAVARLRAAGGILLGKTNCTELCGSGETDNLVYGRTNNPYDLTRSPGGSSGGEAAIIAAGGSPLGLASDFGGSIRGPAHLCGVAGLNPTFGRVPRTGHIPPYGGAYDTARIGLMARFVEDLALALPIIAGPDGMDPSIVPIALGSPKTVNLPELRVAFHTDNGIYPATRETATVVRNAAQALADAGLIVAEACPPGLAQLMEVGATLGCVNALAEQTGVYVEFGQPLDFDADTLRQSSEVWLTRARGMKQAELMSAAELLAWTRRWDLARSEMLAFLARFDVILCPVDPHPALPHGATMRPDFPPFGVTAYTKPYSMAGWPSVVVRADASPAGMPIGVQIVAGPWQEHVALAVAQTIERAWGGWRKSPLW
jgi:amidase